MSANKAKRLSKIAREFNVGISTIVDYLEEQGHTVESSPNTKIEDDLYQVLVGEFQAEKTMKEESKLASVTREKRETITMDDTPKTVAKEPEQEEIMIKNMQEPESIKVESNKLSGPSVVGKIDLDTINPKTRPDKKAKTEEPEEVVETKVEEPEKPVAKEEAPPKKEEAPAKEEEEKPVEKPVETIKAAAGKLSGPTVVGKIDLPVKKEKPKETPESKKAAAENADKRKRKRKRIKKVNVADTGNQNQSNNTQSNTRQKKGGKKHTQKPEVSEKEIQREIKETLARLSGGGKSKSAKMRRAKRDAVAEKREEELQKQEDEKSVLKLTEFVTVSELGSMMAVQVTDIISALMSLGIFASINQRLDAETITMIAEEFGFTVEFISAELQESIEVEEDAPEDLVHRPPIVTVMGHVDHGKTSLLDHIRETNVISGEAGGITQHIGAYSVTGESGKKITFLDTPGHEAFTAMRARGAQVTDVAIIIIAADDDVMPQTVEAINHAQAAGVPMVFAINKVDREEANPDKIKEKLAAMNILVEDWGGKYQSQDISAKKGTGIDELLEKVLLEAELLELEANPNKNAVGTVVESMLDKGRGYVTTLLVEAGTLRVGDMILAGRFHGKVKAMNNEHGQEVKEAGPSDPVSILGMIGAPSAGDRFNVLDDEREAKQIATKRMQLQREQGVRTQKHITLDEIGRRLAIGDFQELNIIVKGDVDGSIEALSDELLKLSTENIQVNVIHKAVGAITESDVLLASASDAIIIGFQVRPTASARRLAENEEIDIRLYSIIYKALEEIKDAMEGLLGPGIEEKIVGTAEIREVFKITKVGTIAGCFVLEGKILRNNQVRVIRDGIVIYTGELGSLKRFKDDVKEVKHGYECGLNVERFNDIKVGDNIEAFEQVEVKRTL
jgi:translation initiation factor IF-2